MAWKSDRLGSTSTVEEFIIASGSLGHVNSRWTSRQILEWHAGPAKLESDFLSLQRCEIRCGVHNTWIMARHHALLSASRRPINKNLDLMAYQDFKAAAKDSNSLLGLMKA
jgi:hypothetical protein